MLVFEKYGGEHLALCHILLYCYEFLAQMLLENDYEKIKNRAQ